MAPTKVRTCSRCGKVGHGNIHMHHKDKNRANNLLTNLIYLCAPCHRQWHAGQWDYKDAGFENTHVTELVAPSMPQDERRVTFPEDVMEALNLWAEEERKIIENPVIRSMITGKEIAQHIVLNELIKRGHYDPKTKKDTP